MSLVYIFGLMPPDHSYFLRALASYMRLTALSKLETAVGSREGEKENKKVYAALHLR